MLTLNTRNFWPAHKHEVNFYPRTKNISISVFTLKPIQFSIPHIKPNWFRPQHWSQANFDPHSKNNSILHAPRHENQLNFDPDSKPSNFSPPHKKRANYDPYTEIKSTPITHNEIQSTSTTHTTTKSISMPTLEPCHFQTMLLLRAIHNSTCSWDTEAIRKI